MVNLKRETRLNFLNLKITWVKQSANRWLLLRNVRRQVLLLYQNLTIKRPVSLANQRGVLIKPALVLNSCGDVERKGFGVKCEALLLIVSLRFKGVEDIEVVDMKRMDMLENLQAMCMCLLEEAGRKVKL